MIRPIYIFFVLFTVVVILLLGLPKIFNTTQENDSPTVHQEVNQAKEVLAQKTVTNRISPLNHEVYENLKTSESTLVGQKNDLSKALGLGPIQDFSYRFKNLTRLKRDLSKSELKEIFLYLSRNTTPNGDDRKEESIRNDLLEILIHQSEVPKELGVFMIANYTDPQSSFIWKDYIIQHIYPYIEKVHFQKAKRQAILRDWKVLSDKEELSQLISVYENAAKQYNSTYSGTALIGLDRLHTEIGLYSKNKLKSLCVKLLKLKSNQLSKTSALQILAEISSEEAFKIAKNVLKSSELNDDSLIASCLNVYIKTGHHLDEDDPIIYKYNNHSLFSKVIKNNLVSK